MPHSSDVTLTAYFSSACRVSVGTFSLGAAQICTHLKLPKLPVEVLEILFFVPLQGCVNAVLFMKGLLTLDKIVKLFKRNTVLQVELKFSYAN